jgi:hypothetical protein
MNSRDRLSGGELRQQIEESLEDLLKQHDGLRALKERRRREEIESKLDDAKPLEDILERLLKQSPTLSNLFLHGLRASTPFKTIEAQAGEQQFKGRRFPTYFKFKGKDYGDELKRECHVNMRCRLAFETDAENEYFSRVIDPGQFRLVLLDDGNETDVQNYVLNLQNGIASLSVVLPEATGLGQTVRYVATVNDCDRTDPFSNTFIVVVKEAQEPRGRDAERRKPPSKEEGDDRERPAGIQMPKIRLVEEDEWENQTPTPFDKYTALRIKNAGNAGNSEDESNSSGVYDFYINMDNLYLKAELKGAKSEPKLVRAQFEYGMVLFGLALLQQDIEDQKKSNADDEPDSDPTNGASVEKKIEEFCRAVAPVVIPMINSLGSLSVEDETVVAASGEAT